MSSFLKLVNGPAVEPLDLDFVRTQHLRVTNEHEDQLIDALIVASRQYAERTMRRALITQTWDLFLDSFPPGATPIVLPMPPLQSVTSVVYTDSGNVPHTLDATAYVMDTAAEPGRIAPKYGTTWPTTALQSVAAVAVRFVCGYGDSGDAVPQTIRIAQRLLIGHWFEHREATAGSSPGGTMPTVLAMAVDDLLGLYMLGGVA